MEFHRTVVEKDKRVDCSAKNILGAGKPQNVFLFFKSVAIHESLHDVTLLFEYMFNSAY